MSIVYFLIHLQIYQKCPVFYVPHLMLTQPLLKYQKVTIEGEDCVLPFCVKLHG